MEIDPVDAVVAAIAARQYGVVTTRQLQAAGLGSAAVSRRLAADRLHRLHRGVYAVGHAAVSLEGRWIAAVLACGDGAVLSHHTAAELWGMLAFERESRQPAASNLASNDVHVSTPARSGRSYRPGIVLHRCPSLAAAGRDGEKASVRLVTRHNGIPVTSPPRTLADLRRAATPVLYRRALRQAEVLGLPIGDAPSDRTRSELERAFLRVCRRHHLPEPAVNARVGPYLVDFLWSRERVVVETDGYRYHRGRASFEEDRARDLRLRESGYEVVRLSHRQVENEQSRVAGLLRRRLAAGRAAPGPDL